MSKKRQLLDEAKQEELMRAYQNTNNGPLRTRYQAVRLYGMGYKVDEILTITGCSVSRLRAWYAKYLADGLNALIDQRQGGNHYRLSAEQKAELSERLQHYTPAQLFGTKAATRDGQFWSVPDLAAAIERWYAVRYDSLTSYRALFKECRFSYQKSSGVYQSRSENDVAEYSAALEKKGSGLLFGSTTDPLFSRG